MTKLTWLESSLNHIKNLISNDTSHYDSNNHNVFSIKQLSEASLSAIVSETMSRSKMPARNLDKTLRELRDYNILKHRTDLGKRVYEYIPDNHNEELVYKDRRSTGHIRIVNCLKRLGIHTEEEKTFKDLKHHSFLRLDIYFKWLGKSFAIEYDGAQHHNPVEIWGGEDSLVAGKCRDNIKEDYCELNGIVLFRVNHTVKDIENHVKMLLTGAFWQCIAEFLLIRLIHLQLRVLRVTLRAKLGAV